MLKVYDETVRIVHFLRAFGWPFSEKSPTDHCNTFLMFVVDGCGIIKGFNKRDMSLNKGSMYLAGDTESMHAIASILCRSVVQEGKVQVARGGHDCLEVSTEYEVLLDLL